MGPNSRHTCVGCKCNSTTAPHCAPRREATTVEPRGKIVKYSVVFQLGIPWCSCGCRKLCLFVCLFVCVTVRILGFWNRAWLHLTGILRRVRNIAKSNYYLSYVCPTEWKNLAATGRISIKFDTCVFSENLPRNFEFHQNMRRMTGTSHEGLFTLVIISRSFLLWMSGRGVTLTPLSLLVPWSWKCRAIHLLPLWAARPVQSLSACTRAHFTFSSLNEKCFRQSCIENRNTYFVFSFF